MHGRRRWRPCPSAWRSGTPCGLRRCSGSMRWCRRCKRSWPRPRGMEAPLLERQQVARRGIQTGRQQRCGAAVLLVICSALPFGCTHGCGGCCDLGRKTAWQTCKAHALRCCSLPEEQPVWLVGDSGRQRTYVAAGCVKGRRPHHGVRLHLLPPLSCRTGLLHMHYLHMCARTCTHSYTSRAHASTCRPVRAWPMAAFCACIAHGRLIMPMVCVQAALGGRYAH